MSPWHAAALSLSIPAHELIGRFGPEAVLRAVLFTAESIAEFYALDIDLAAKWAKEENARLSKETREERRRVVDDLIKKTERRE